MQPPDIFLWANQVDAVKREIEVELYFFNKHYTPYRVATTAHVDREIKPLLMHGAINFVSLGAGTGLKVSTYDNYQGEDNELLYVPLDDVVRAHNLIGIINEQTDDILMFSAAEHEFKRMQGLVLVCTMPNGKKFYIAKQIAQARSLKGSGNWVINNENHLESFTQEAVFQVPTDEQVLVFEGHVYAFNVKKFESLFNYEFSRNAVIDQKIAEIEKRYKLSFPEGLTLRDLIYDRKKAQTKILDMEIGVIEQGQAVEYADNIGLELMTDDAGSIIILDGNDLDVFLNLINEDYSTNDITGRQFEIKKKKLLYTEHSDV